MVGITVNWKYFLEKLKNEGIENFFEIGSHLSEDAYEVKKYFNLQDNNIYCFEINENNYISAKKFFPFFNHYNIGISDFDGESNFYVENSTGSSLLKEINSNYPIKKAKILTMDTFINQNNIKNIDFCKIDVEGLAGQVLLGFKDKLQIVKFLHIEADDNNKYFLDLIYNTSWILNYLNNFEIIDKVENTGKIRNQTLLLLKNRYI
jgi:FkbM family methyltransferase